MEVGILWLLVGVMVFFAVLFQGANIARRIKRISRTTWLSLAVVLLVGSCAKLALALIGPPVSSYPEVVLCPSKTLGQYQQTRCANVRATLTAEARWPWVTPRPAYYVYDEAFYATQTAAAAPGGSYDNAVAVTLHQLVAYPESYQGKWVEMRDVPVLHVYCSSEFTVGTPSESVYVDYSVPIPPLSFQEGDNIDLVIGKVGGNCKGSHPAKTLMCGYVYAHGPIIFRPKAPWWKACIR